MNDYDRIARAIDYLASHARQQPSLDEVAAHLNLSPYHFQRLFSRWAGITPKQFLQVLTLEHSRSRLARSQPLLALADDVGLSSGSRLHEHFVRIEAVTPGEYRRQGEGVQVEYGVHPTPFGEVFIARTRRGICRAAFLGPAGLTAPLEELAGIWPKASMVQDQQVTQSVADVIAGASAADSPLSLHVPGTNFQVAVWRALLRIPEGTVASYAEVARALGQPRASRAVGNAVGANPVAWLIPCHRVILGSGALGHYRWGPARKQAIQVWEQARIAEPAVSPLS